MCFLLSRSAPGRSGAQSAPPIGGGERSRWACCFWLDKDSDDDQKCRGIRGPAPTAPGRSRSEPVAGAGPVDERAHIASIRCLMMQTGRASSARAGGRRPLGSAGKANCRAQRPTHPSWRQSASGAVTQLMAGSASRRRRWRRRRRASLAPIRRRLV